MVSYRPQDIPDWVCVLSLVGDDDTLVAFCTIPFVSYEADKHYELRYELCGPEVCGYRG